MPLWTLEHSNVFGERIYVGSIALVRRVRYPWNRKIDVIFKKIGCDIHVRGVISTRLVLYP